jgi:hypothetical protein
VPFDYYRSLSPQQRRTYRASDRITRVALSDPARLRAAVSALREALASGDRRRVQQACTAVAVGVCDDLGITRVRVKVGGRRPTDSGGRELLGQCSWDEEETKGALVAVWMRTAGRGQVVAFKTLLRTLIHELCHHLDYELHGLDGTYHTEGFFRRESSIMRQLVDLTAASEEESQPDPETDHKPAPAPQPGGQLGFDF